MCLARCVFVPTNFFKFWDKDALAFSAKRDKNFGTQFLVLLEI